MRGLDIRNIANWNYSTFKSWLGSAGPNSDENESFDFKENFYSSPRECRKDFASFANSEGGFIIFGIENRSKNIIGVEEFDLGTKLDDFLALNCLDPRLKWENTNKFKVNKSIPRRFIYVVKIEKTFPFWNRPHISDGVIYIRTHGKSEPIKTLAEIRQKFFQKIDFIPEDLIYFDEVLKSLSSCDYSVDVLDIFIVRLWVGIKFYLNSIEQEKLGVLRGELLGLYAEINEYITEVKRKKSEQTVSTGMPDAFVSGTGLEALYEKISGRLLIFRDKFSKLLIQRYE